jgi:BirA family biotin operon repressor/biotin-[acetyl-CoA-carboxylase] ligase
MRRRWIEMRRAQPKSRVDSLHSDHSGAKHENLISLRCNGRGWERRGIGTVDVDVAVVVDAVVADLGRVRHFFISIVVSLSILEALEGFKIKNLKVKWPNDILSENKKISGILIENVIKQTKINATIIGFGVNVNQTEFEHLPQASSMRLISGKVYVLEEVLQSILERLEHYFIILKKNQFEILKKAYENHLFRKDKPSTFKDIDGRLFSGYIKGVSNSGNLHVMVEEDLIKEFDLKSITLLY